MVLFFIILGFVIVLPKFIAILFDNDSGAKIEEQKSSDAPKAKYVVDKTKTKRYVFVFLTITLLIAIWLDCTLIISEVGFPVFILLALLIDIVTAIRYYCHKNN